MKTTRAIVQPLEPTCPTCMDGTMPTEYTRTGRATYVCDGCGRDVSMAVLFFDLTPRKQ